MNQSRASSAAAARVPGSSNRWVGVGYHGQLVLAAQLGLGPAVEAEHLLIAPADDEQRGRRHGPEARTGEIGTSATGHHGRNVGAGSAAAHSAAAAPVLARK